MRRTFRLTGKLSTVEVKYSYLCPDNTPAALASFHELLNSAGVHLEDHVSPTNEQAFTNFWIELFSMRVIRAGLPVMYGSDMDRMIGLLARHNVLKNIITDKEHCQVLACICTARVVLAAMGFKYPEKHNLADLLQKWLGLKPSVDILTKVPDFVDYLYGPGVWELYGKDVEQVHLVPEHLFNHGVWLSCNKPGNSYIGPDALPDSF